MENPYIASTLARFARFECEARSGRFHVMFPRGDSFALELARDTAETVTESRNARGFSFGFIAAFTTSKAARDFRQDCLA